MGSRGGLEAAGALRADRRIRTRTISPTRHISDRDSRIRRHFRAETAPGGWWGSPPVPTSAASASVVLRCSTCPCAASADAHRVQPAPGRWQTFFDRSASLSSDSSHSRAQPSQPETIDPAGMRVIWLLLVAAFVAILNETTMAIAIPELNASLGIPPELGQWMTSAFMLTMAVVIPTTGFLLQRFTTRQIFLAAMILFTSGTLICLVAPGFTVLLIGRVVQAGG